MPGEPASRRSALKAGLGIAGAIGLANVLPGEAQAAEYPPYLRSGFAGTLVSLRGNIASVVGDSPEGLVQHPVHGFGQFKLTAGDRVTVGLDNEGVWHVMPRVQQESFVADALVAQVGSQTTVNDKLVLLDSTEAALELASAQNAGDAKVTALLVANANSRKLRVFGILREKRSGT